MLTLLESPGGGKRGGGGGKRRVDRPSNTGKRLVRDTMGHLLPRHDDGLYDEMLPEQHSNRIGKYLCSSDSGDYSDKWREDYSHRPSWCDAGMALYQIRNGKASGNSPALWLRSLLQKILFWLGSFIQRYALEVLVLGVIVFGVCCAGLQNVRIEDDIVKLWVSQGGRLDEELNFLSRVRRKSQDVRDATDQKKPEVPRENGLGGGFQVVIQTPDIPGKNILNKRDLLKHVQIMNEIANYEVDMHGENWTLSDICFKPPSPTIDSGALGNLISALLDRIVPCIWITPIDCFWEGSKPLGPFPPIPISPDVGAFISSLPKGNVTWKNLNPTRVLDEVGSLFDLGTIADVFERAGVGSAYLDRWCIEPLDAECPVTGPNGYDICPAVHKFIAWNETLADAHKIYLQEEPLPVEDDEGTGDFLADLLGEKKKDERDIPCLKYGMAVRQWMLSNENRWNEFLSEKEQPVYANYGDIMTGGCQGFAREIMSWPEDLIIGGVKRQDGKIVSAEAFQSVFLVSGGHDVFLRWKDPKPELKPQMDTKAWTTEKAVKMVHAWQRNFTQNIYDHEWNMIDPPYRQVHPLASTSISDMLKEFSKFKFVIIVVGYFFMLLYAGLSLMRLRNCRPEVDSCAGLGFAGVLLVTFASVSGLGMSTWMGIEFNAATTQIVPFLTLGLGVDDMFLLVHNYQEVVKIVNQNQIGFLMKETGLSVLLTSINNILAFMAGSILPVPALRSFCTQTAILLFFNVIAIVTLYPALMALDLKRRKRNALDLCCCVRDRSAEDKPTVTQRMSYGKTTVPPVPLGDRPPPYTDLENSADSVSTDSGQSDYGMFSLEGFLHKFYIPFLKKGSVKMAILAVCTVMLGAGVAGLSRTTLGLELSDVLPRGTPPSAFLAAREKYFSFYPMFAVLKGPGIDYAAMQHQIEAYRLKLADSRFVVKVEGRPSEEYWMSMMKTWLNSMQTHYDEALAVGKIDNVTGVIAKGVELPDEAKIGRRLICSFGNTFNCTGRIGQVRLVDSTDTINYEGFNNYLTAWFNLDNMMYYVSQASFHPPPPSWGMDDKDTVVPPAQPLAYSQIPLYLTNLVDTPAIMEAIRDIRMRCEEFTDSGLPNFPSGIPFTFWEQYLHLTNNLLFAILVITGAVFLVISVLLFNPWTAAMVVGVVLVMVVELSGFMGWAGLKLNPVSAVSLVTAVGIGVEFTVHVCLSFLTSLGGRNDRMARTLR